MVLVLYHTFWCLKSVKVQKTAKKGKNTKNNPDKKATIPVTDESVRRR